MFYKISALVLIVLLFPRFLDYIIKDNHDVKESIEALLKELPDFPDDLGEDDDLDEVVHIVCVLCGRGHRLDEAEMMVKSAVLHTQTDLHFTIVTDQQELLEPRIRAILGMTKQFSITINFHLPGDFMIINSFCYAIFAYLGQIEEKDSDIVNTWAPCIGLRTYFPSLFPNFKKIIYVDTDVLFQDSPHNLWRHFQYMNRSQIIGVAVDQALLSISSYDNDVSFPSPPGGLNTGVMLLNLERMRKIGYKDIVLKIIKHFKDLLALPDQDVKNILTGLFPKLLYRLPVSWNSNIMTCAGCIEEQPLCKINQIPGSNNVSLIHGTSHTFHQSVSITTYQGIKMFHEKLFRLFKTYQSNFTTLTKYVFFPYFISNSVGWEQVTILQQIFQTYKNIDLENVCQTLETQIVDTWESNNYEGYWCEQYVPDIVYSLNKLHNRHCQK